MLFYRDLHLHLRKNKQPIRPLLKTFAAVWLQLLNMEHFIVFFVNKNIYKSNLAGLLVNGVSVTPVLGESDGAVLRHLAGGSEGHKDGHEERLEPPLEHAH